MRIFLAIAAILLTAGCAASRQAYYDAASNAAAANASASKAQFDALAVAAEKCSTDSCAGMAMMGIALTRPPEAQAPAQYIEPGLRILGTVDRVIGAGGQILGEKFRMQGMVDLVETVSTNSGDRSQHFDYSDHSATDNSVSIADSYNEQGDTISDSGNTTIENSNNGNAGRDLIGRDRIDNSGNIGQDNRQDSPGPIDQSDDGDDCSGESCNPITPEIDP